MKLLSFLVSCKGKTEVPKKCPGTLLRAGEAGCPVLLSRAVCAGWLPAWSWPPPGSGRESSIAPCPAQGSAGGLQHPSLLDVLSHPTRPVCCLGDRGGLHHLFRCQDEASLHWFRGRESVWLCSLCITLHGWIKRWVCYFKRKKSVGWRPRALFTGFPSISALTQGPEIQKGLVA